MKLNAKAFLADLRTLVEDIEQGAIDAVGKAVAEATKYAQTTTLFQDRTTDLRTKIYPYHSRYEGSVTASASYALYVNAGTRPHTIQASGNRGGDGRRLYFVYQGVQWNVPLPRALRHPGTKPRPFMDEAKEWGELALQQSADRNMQDAISKFNAK